jgi:predicted amidohydrolase
MTCRVAAVQISLRKKTYEETIKDAQALISQAAKAGAQIICLPEHWLLQYWRTALDAPTRLADTARAEHVFLITGANYTPNQSPIRIRSTLISPDGQTVGWQDKVHLFRDEPTIAQPGEEYKILETSLGKVGITICYDNAFPEAARAVALQGADLLFVPSRIITEGIEPWALYLKTRALENRIPVIAPNVSDPPQFSGASTIITLEESKTSPVILPKVAALAKNDETVIVADLDIEEARKLRAKRLSERNPAAYRLTQL